LRELQHNAAIAAVRAAAIGKNAQIKSVFISSLAQISAKTPENLLTR
jgi:hypothetical protein